MVNVCLVERKEKILEDFYRNIEDRILQNPSQGSVRFPEGVGFKGNTRR